MPAGKGTYRPTYKPASKATYSSYKPKVNYRPRTAPPPPKGFVGGQVNPVIPGNKLPKAFVGGYNTVASGPNPKNIQAGPRETSGTSRIGPRYSGPINAGGGGYGSGYGGGISSGGAPGITQVGTPTVVAPPPITVAPPAPPTVAPGVSNPTTTGSWTSRGRGGTYGQYNRQRRMRGPITGLSMTPEMLRRIAMQRFRQQ
jgi:hypothetical protein